jgi:hypothetical protein
MKPEDDEFTVKIQNEIERLKALTRTLEGPDQEQILTIIEILEQECGQREKRESSTALQEAEKIQSWHVLIDMLNKIEDRVKELETAIEREQTWFTSRESAQRIVHDFFYDCQEAERLIKHYERKGFITRGQLSDLHVQLREIVQKMVVLFGRSEDLVNAVLQSYATQIFS